MRWMISPPNSPSAIVTAGTSPFRRPLNSAWPTWLAFRRQRGTCFKARQKDTPASCVGTTKRGRFLFPKPMSDQQQLLAVLRRHGVPFVVIGGHAVNFHGYIRTTEDVDVVWLRSPQAEQDLLAALTEVHAAFISNEIDP